ncbi:MAG: low specificity L-threonine aldolase [Solobacterium sp.]|nr:low specificity L-threonine aldolase [Solobacterium sp.]
MLMFASDYMEGALPEILKRLSETNLISVPGYGDDAFSLSAKEKIRNAISCRDAQITFLAGGTQTNQVVIDTLLKDWQGVLSASTGHINTHEAGAIEHGGHKVLALPSHDGKMDPYELEAFLKTFYADENNAHMVEPGMVYLTHPTEYGTLYSLKELRMISEIARAYEIPVYLDGARLAYALGAQNDVSLKDIAEYTDVFYIGGTKCGSLIGEALVFTRNNEPDHFVGLIKQRGALLAKGRLIGLSFDTLFTDALYERAGRHAVELAMKLKAGLKQKGYRLFIDSPTNQQFVILDNQKLKELKKEVTYSFWEKYDENHTVVRFATSWATEEENVERLLELL